MDRVSAGGRSAWRKPVRAYLKLAAIILVGVLLQRAIDVTDGDDWTEAGFAARCYAVHLFGTAADEDRLVEEGRRRLAMRIERDIADAAAPHVAAAAAPHVAAAAAPLSVAKAE
jgi:hypothetical protein